MVFHKPDDCDGFLDLMAESSVRAPMASLLLPNAQSLPPGLWPRQDGDVSRWMHWLMTTQVRRYLTRYRSSGHVGQGRFKAFPIQEDEHLFSVLRYLAQSSASGFFSWRKALKLRYNLRPRGRPRGTEPPTRKTLPSFTEHRLYLGMSPFPFPT